MANPLGIGGVQKGEVRNPSGRPPGIFTGAAWSQIVSSVWEEYESHELIELANDIAAGKRVNVSSKKAIAIVNLASALQRDGKERERLLDRLLGKAVQRIGGENPGEGIRIASAMRLESIDYETLETIALALREVKEKQLAIEGESKVVDSSDQPSE